jgi:nucleoside-diphosphate-sugar epimerase
MQTILGANGIIGQELSRHLPRYTSIIRQVSRNPRKVNPADELMKADLLNYDDVEKAVAGSKVVYLLAGLKYDVKVWQQQWPVIMRNTMDACKKHQAKLVFFDNAYAYGLVKGVMTEETPYNPVSRKGEVRAKIATTLMEEVKSGNLNAMIIRAADFYGPGAKLSLIQSAVTERLKAERKRNGLVTLVRYIRLPTPPMPGEPWLSWAILMKLLTRCGMHLPARKELQAKSLFAELIKP